MRQGDAQSSSDYGKAAPLTIAFLRLCDSTQLHKRLPACFLRSHATPQTILNVQLHVGLDLGGEFLVARTPEHRGQTQEPRSQRSHNVSLHMPKNHLSLPLLLWDNHITGYLPYGLPI